MRTNRAPNTYLEVLRIYSKLIVIVRILIKAYWWLAQKTLMYYFERPSFRSIYIRATHWSLRCSLPGVIMSAVVVWKQASFFFSKGPSMDNTIDESFLTSLPPEVIRLVVHYCRALDLLSLLETCHTFRCQQDLWRGIHTLTPAHLCLLTRCASELIQKYFSVPRPPHSAKLDYSAQFRRDSKLLFNWHHGNYHSMKLDGHSGGVACLDVDKDLIASGSGSLTLHHPFPNHCLHHLL